MIYVLTCGHETEAPAPATWRGDADILPRATPCPTCGRGRRAIAYTTRRAALSPRSARRVSARKVAE